MICNICTHLLQNSYFIIFQITRRYAEFSGALVSLNETFPDERVNRQLARLQTEVQNFILRMAAEFPPRKEQLIFLINNYDMMLNVITVSWNDMISFVSIIIKHYYAYFHLVCQFAQLLCRSSYAITLE